ncbi:MAG: FAD-dependent oxidoreductase [Myxococcota bacterium]
MKIAILGSGIAGLACAHHLGPRHEITLFEAEPRLGGHAHTVDVEVAGRSHAVDTGFIVYNETTYPELTRLLRDLAVATRPAEMSFGLSCEASGLEWSSRGLQGLFATPELAFRLPFLRMVYEILRFAREANALLEEGDPKQTLRELVVRRGYSDRFRDDYLAPMGAAIWSAGSDVLLDMPAASFVRFFQNHGLLGRGGGVQWRTLVGGSRAYVDALARRLRGRIALSTPVLGVRPEPRGVAVRLASGTERFDRVVFAVHADTALSLLEEPSREQRRILGAFRFSRNETVLHTDASLLPRRPAARASWNSLVSGASRERVVVTYDLSRLQSIPSAEPLLVTLNGSERIDPARILGRYDYAHPILDGPAIDAQREHARIDGVGGIHFCGAWWRWGFHEDGLASALRVVQSIEAVG